MEVAMQHKLMIKRCLHTGLMYLCKTSSTKIDPYTYQGSGHRWLNHVKKHKSHIITCIIGEYETKEELAAAGLYYSKLYDVVHNPNWANLTEEKGDGGLIGTGQLGKRWKIKDTSKMKGTKRITEAKLESWKKISAERNYQFKGWIVTPWGRFSSIKHAVLAARLLKQQDQTIIVLTDGTTVKKYINNLDVPLNKEGRRTPKFWRGKTPRELGFNLEIDEG
jgi:hypothetical protein